MKTKSNENVIIKHLPLLFLWYDYIIRDDDTVVFSINLHDNEVEMCGCLNVYQGDIENLFLSEKIDHKND